MFKSLIRQKYLGAILFRNTYAVKIRLAYIFALIAIIFPHHYVLAQTTTEYYAALSEDKIINNDSENQDASIRLLRK
ncbi:MULTISPECIES: hypothetical protein [Okeania]|uniref:Uncharacterized protein n=1 Tax=Okeania hirsuta TaxID=1458930 RepID=A0A3N6Q9R2_9CYAN|nr:MULTISPECIES: hypothetical protein [Okeania]NEP06485.1 hypothetical protein [Okeania sp. SIO4D6]NEP38400.1 hypothetical protein [Okeania sp. SIO2H7]NET11480.1 hypothetical protein [Okeania sp. SIO1H6]NEP71670.1 hypothetical protein [Okeania sp. SIO2G5]NEP91765.1 hypothetical protein [Okeania sp. SIO2F5]